MKQKRMLALLTAVICLIGLMAGMLSGCGKKKLQVSFDMNWNEANIEPESIEVKTGDTYGQLPQIAPDIREGYTFGGWYLDDDCKGEEVTAETVVTAEEDHTLYAKWIGDQITVSFDLQGGNINGVSTVEDAVVTVGNVYSMMAIPEDPERDNHSFLGWFYDPEGKEGPVITSTKVVKTEDHTLYAVWNEYKMFYDFEESGGSEVFSVAQNLKFGIENYNGSNQLKITNPGTDKPEGTMLMWLPLKTGTRVTMDVTFTGELPAEAARMYMFCYGVNESGVAMTEGLLDINESETHRRWYHGNGYRAMQENGTWYYGDEGNWTEGNTCKFEMIIMEDCAGLYMNFCLGSELTQEQFGNNAIYIDNIEFTPNYYRVLEDGMMGTSPYGATDKGLYFSMRDNGLPYDSDWKVYYSATTPDNIKIIRNGKVYRVAEVGCDNICKFSATDYYLRLEEYTIGIAAPISTSDMFIVEGDFANGNDILSIKKAYIYHNGTEWVVVDQLPEELAPASEEATDMPDPYYGILRSHEGGVTDGGIHFRLSDNGLPFSKDWNVYYDATTADNIKIIRDGKVYRAAQVGCDNICKFDKDSYYLRLESYTIGSYAPFTKADIFIIEGDFVYEKSTLRINKTYLYYNGSEWVFATKLPANLAPETEEPSEPEFINDGIMRASGNGATDSGIYFTMKDNGLPFGDWSVYYGATSTNNVKLIRDGKVYAAAQVGCDNICKFTATDYYLRLENYTIGGYAPFTTQDIFIVEGDFTYQDTTLALVKNYIYHDGTAWVFATELPENLKPETEEPTVPNENPEGMMSGSINGATDGGIYFTMKDNALPYSADWNVYYDATSANNIKIIRGGKVYAAAQIGCDNICKFSETDYYLRLENYTIGEYAPFTTQDIFIVEGDFTYEDATLTVVKTYIYHDGAAWVFAAELPENLKPETEEPTVPDDNNDGKISASVNGATEGGIYFTMKDNGLPYGDWNVYYDAASANSLKIIRGGKVYAAAQVGCDNICKFTATDYYLRLESHTIGEYAPISTQDIFIVEGDFTYEDSTLTIVKTYIYHDGTAWVFAAELPENLKPETEEPTVPDENTDGMMSASGNGATDTGIYFTMKDNGLPYGDWNVYYDATSADNIKIIRNGVIYSAAQVGCDNICKFGATDYYLKLESWTIGDYAPFSTQDIFVVEGDFTYEDATLTIVKTYIYHDGTAWVFAAELPEDLKPDGGEDTPSGAQWPFDFETGSVSTDIFKLRDSDLSMTVEDFGGSKQLKLQPTATTGNYWLWLDLDLTAGTVIELDVTFARKLGAMSLYMYGAKDNGDPITEGTVSETVPQVWFYGQGVDADFTGGNTNTQTITFTAYEDCHGIAFMLGYGNKKPNVIYLDNIALKDGSADVPELGNGTGVLSANAAGVNVEGNIIKGIYATGAATNAVFDPDWAVEYNPAEAGNFKLIRGGVTYDVGVPGSGTIVMLSQTDMYLKLESWTVSGDLLPLQAGDILVVEGQWICNQDASSTVQITTTYILIGDGTATFSATNPNGGQQEPGTNSVGVLSAHNGGVNINSNTNTIVGIYVTGAATNATYNSNWSVEYTPAAAGNYKLIRGGTTYDLGIPGAGTMVMFGQTEFYLKLEDWLIGDVYPIRSGDVLVVEGEWSCKQDASSSVNIAKTYILFTDNSASFSDTEPGSED